MGYAPTRKNKEKSTSARQGKTRIQLGILRIKDSSLALKPAYNDGTTGITEHIHAGPQHIQDTINREDQPDGFNRQANRGKDDRNGNQAG
jgi:hypothetical protein